GGGAPRRAGPPRARAAAGRAPRTPACAVSRRPGRARSRRALPTGGRADGASADATLARSSCLASAPSVPERRLPARPIQTEGRRFGNVTSYEILLLLDPELPEERQSEVVARIRELVERGGGTWSNQDIWGRRKLAYEID